MIKSITHCTDEELTAIVRSTNPTGRFAVEREDALQEMGRRVASEYIARERDVWDCISDHRVEFN